MLGHIEGRSSLRSSARNARISLRHFRSERACGADASLSRWIRMRADKALDLAQLRLPHVLDLLGHVRQVEFVRQVAARLRQAAQNLGLLLCPGVNVVLVI